MSSDSEAFTRLWTRAQPTVAGYIGALVPDFHTAEDILQDVAVVLLRKFGEYDPQHSFTGWALGIAKYSILDRRRTAARSIVGFKPEIVESVAAECANMAPELEERTAALRVCFQNVKGRAWELLKLRYEESLTPQQIAERMGLEPGAVRTGLSRIRTSLHECVERKLSLEGRAE